MRADLRGATFSFINPPARWWIFCSIVSHLLLRLRISDNHINGLALSPSSQGSKHLYYRWILSIKSKFKLRWCNIDIGIDIDLFLQPLNGARTVECGDPGAEWGRERTCDQEGERIFSSRIFHRYLPLIWIDISPHPGICPGQPTYFIFWRLNLNS